MYEVLAPVGNNEMLIAAVRSGADAVYFGAKDFSARRNAENFGDFELKNVIEYCHIRGVKAYLTLNIPIKDSEMADAVELAKNAYNFGIDGVIVQDIGLAKVLHKLLPDLSLHASTQMSIHTPAALPILKQMGFTQVVVAREMSLEDLKEFCVEAEKYNITVEAFVHGALCMSVSGQCLLSAYLGSRSGNRGLCAGPCRLPFKVENGTGYDLSLKDLSHLDYVSELYNIGVRSFKIEGRMKRPEYVAAATKACKTALQTGAVPTDLAETLKNVFSRSGFTSGYLENKLGRDMFGIRTKDDVVSADKAFPLLHEIYRNELQSVAVEVSFKAKKGEEIMLSLCDGENTASVAGPVPDLAQNKAADRESVIKNLNKFGGTPYFAEKLDISLDDGLFLPASVINDLRRQATEMLSEKRGRCSRKTVDIIFGGDKPAEYMPKPLKTYIRLENTEQIPNDFSGISAVIVPLEKDFPLLEGVKNIVEIPRGIISEKAIADRLNLYKQQGFDTALCGNLSAVSIAKSCGFNVMADTGLNIYNSNSLSAVADLEISSAILSNEMLLTDAVAVNSPIEKGIISYGKIPLMLFKNCPIKNGKSCADCDKNNTITDRMGIEFPVRCRMGYSELLNSVPVWVLDKKQSMKNLDFELLYFTNEDKQRVAEVITAAKTEKQPDHKHTRGLFFRGVI